MKFEKLKQLFGCGSGEWTAMKPNKIFAFFPYEFRKSSLPPAWFRVIFVHHKALDTCLHMLSEGSNADEGCVLKALSQE